MLADLRYGFRTLLQAKGWTAVVLVSIAIGIGANTALFSAVNGLLFRKLPVGDADSLVRFRWSGEPRGITNRGDYGYLPHGVGSTFPYAVFKQFAVAARTTTGVLACAPIGDAHVVIDGQAEITSALVASGNYYQVLGITAVRGRTLLPADDDPTAPPAGVISHRYWVSRFGGQADTIGKVIRVNGVPVTIVGVEPPSFTGIQHAVSEAREITLPLALEPRLNPTPRRLHTPTAWWLQIAARTKPGIQTEQVRLNLEHVFQRAARGDGGAAAGPSGAPQASQHDGDGSRTARLHVESATHGMYDARPDRVEHVTILSAVVALALLLVCANVSNLLLSRAAVRQKEFGVRLSLGASRGRLIRQLLTESLLLALIGGALGLVVADWGRHLLPGPAAPLDWRVLVFAVAATTLVGLVFGILPALRATSVAINTTLKDNSRSVIPSRTMLGRSLIAVQVAVSLVLVTAAGLFVRTVENLRDVDLGFDARQLLVFRVDPGLTRQGDAQMLSLYERLRTRLETMPGVTGVALAAPAPLSGYSSQTDLYLADRTYPPGDRGHHVYEMVVSADFFRIMDMRVLSGRSFTPTDGSAGPKVAVVNETAARQHFGGTPLGRRFGTFPGGADYEIVGVVRDARYNSLREPAPPTVYVPLAQQPQPSAFVQVRAANDPMSIVASVREAVRQVDANLPLANISTHTEQIDQRVAQEKVFARACLLFGAMALLLAAVGLFGLMSFTVARRTNEIGIRMALGAQRTHIRRLMMHESLIPLTAGVAAGVCAALVAGRLIASLLFGVGPADPATMLLAVTILVIVAGVATYVPMWRATHIDPLEALRYE